VFQAACSYLFVEAVAEMRFTLLCGKRQSAPHLLLTAVQFSACRFTCAARSYLFAKDVDEAFQTMPCGLVICSPLAAAVDHSAVDHSIPLPACLAVFHELCSYLFVEDVAEAFDTVLHKGDIGEVYNIGTEKERSVLDVSCRPLCCCCCCCCSTAAVSSLRVALYRWLLLLLVVGRSKYSWVINSWWLWRLSALHKGGMGRIRGGSPASLHAEKERSVPMVLALCAAAVAPPLHTAASDWVPLTYGW
jgi:hypothetical protein